MARVGGLLRWAVVGLLAAGCTSKEADPGDDGTGDGEGIEVPPYEEKSFNPTLVVMDEANFPLANVAVDFDGKRSMTDAKGQVTLPSLAVDGVLAVSIVGTGYVPTFAEISFDNSFPQRTVVLQRTVQAIVDAQKGGKIKLGRASVQLPGGAMIKGNGTPYEGEVVVAVAATAPDKDPEWARDPKDVPPKGWSGPAQTKSGGIYVELKDKNGEPLAFAQGESAQIKVAVPKGADAQKGKQYDLASLDPKTGDRPAEAKCTVVEEDGELLCVGRVEHFSTWLVSWNVRAGARADLGCAQYSVVLTEPAPEGVTLRTYIGALGVDAGTWLNGSPGPKVCALGAAGQKPRIMGTWSSGDFRSFEFELKDALPAGSLTIQSALASDCGPDSTLKCAQYTVRINPNDYSSDSDKDGAPDVADCSPEDPNIYPGAPRNFCEDVDRDCDGKPDGGNLAKLRADDPSEWNALCPWIKAACSAELTPEEPGNEVDENCDGFASDVDGDDYYVLGDPAAPAGSEADCDDFDKAASPAGTEVAGNMVDENCDGVYGDADDDGVKSAKELVAEVGSGNLDVSKVDCNDFDADVKPGASVKDAQPFVTGGAFYDGDGKRTEDFCKLFDANGKLSRYGWSVMRGSDRNCNGVLEDLDGDGELVAAGGPFANEAPYDLNDLDPGVTSKGGKEATGATCEGKPDLTNFGGGKYRVCPLLFGLEQACVEAKDQQMQGTGIYVCAAYDYTGFKIAPNPLQPAKQYGPCSEVTACDGEANLQCGGPATFSDAYVNQLASAPDGIDLSEVAFQGICMPQCAPL